MTDTARTLHLVMYPWFAMGHLTSFLHLSNKLAQRGHKISFILPPKAQLKLNSFNLHPQLITFIPITVPHVDGLPPGAETTNEVSLAESTLLLTAMDHTEKDISRLLYDLKPDFVIYDFSYWMPATAHALGIKSVHYCTMNAASVAYLLIPSREEENKLNSSSDVDELHLMQQPKGFPCSTIKLRQHEARLISFIESMDFGGVTFHERSMRSLKESDAIAFKTCREMEGPFLDYIQSQFGNAVLVTGSIVSDAPSSTLEDRWASWLGGFQPRSVVYCSFGSECILKKDQMQELLLGFELTGLPFFVALKAPEGMEKIEDALPDGFQERIGGRGVVYDGWVQQQFILAHPSVGCFVTHCGSGSISEALVSECQLVLLPHSGDQYVNARLMGGDLKVGVEIEKGEEDGLFTRESVSKAVKLVMDEDSEIGREVRVNHSNWKNILLSEGFESSYVESFIQKLQGLWISLIRVCFLFRFWLN